MVEIMDKTTKEYILLEFMNRSINHYFKKYKKIIFNSVHIRKSELILTFSIKTNTHLYLINRVIEPTFSLNDFELLIQKECLKII